MTTKTTADKVVTLTPQEVDLLLHAVEETIDALPKAEDSIAGSALRGHLKDLMEKLSRA